MAAALTLAWLPGLAVTAITGDIAAKVGPYTSSATHALDLGLVAPVAALLTLVAGGLLIRMASAAKTPSRHEG